MSGLILGRDFLWFRFSKQPISLDFGWSLTGVWLYCDIMISTLNTQSQNGINKILADSVTIICVTCKVYLDLVFSGLCPLNSSLWLPCDSAYPWTLYARADKSYPGWITPAYWETSTRSIWQLCDSACAGAWHTRGQEQDCSWA